MSNRLRNRGEDAAELEANGLHQRTSVRSVNGPLRSATVHTVRQTVGQSAAYVVYHAKCAFSFQISKSQTFQQNSSWKWRKLIASGVFRNDETRVRRQLDLQ